MEINNNNGWPIVSQDPDVAPKYVKDHAERRYLPELVRAWKHIEQTSGFKWKSTSYWRKSPSHQHGVALDIAPDIAPSAEDKYAVTHMSDPVLYKREKLIRKLQVAAHSFEPGPYLIGVFIEPDHLHMQVLTPDSSGLGMRIIKWKVPKPVYGDTEQRMRLPLFL